MIALVQNFDAEGKPVDDAGDSAVERNLTEVAGRVKEHSATLPEGTVLDRGIVKEALKTWNVSGSGLDGGERVMDDDEEKIVLRREPDDSLLPKYLAEGDSPEAAHEVNVLLDFAVHGDIKKGLRIAKKRSPFVEDAFHDALVDNILPKMRQRGLI